MSAGRGAALTMSATRWLESLPGRFLDEFRLIGGTEGPETPRTPPRNTDGELFDQL